MWNFPSSLQPIDLLDVAAKKRRKCQLEGVSGDGNLKTQKSGLKTQTNPKGPSFQVSNEDGEWVWELVSRGLRFVWSLVDEFWDLWGKAGPYLLPTTHYPLPGTPTDFAFGRRSWCNGAEVATENTEDTEEYTQVMARVIYFNKSLFQSKLGSEDPFRVFRVFRGD